MTTPEPRFERLRLLGTGATARVELARLQEPFGDLDAGDEVAVKSLAPEREVDPWVESAFRAEAEAGRSVRDPSLVRVLHHGEQDGRPYLLLQYVPGRTLRDALRKGPLPEPLVRSVGTQLAGALTALHAAGIAHGDVKPENVRLDDAGRAVLIDLGFACRFDRPEGQESPGGRGGDMGSLAYLAPERARGAGPSAAADVFALGILLYELATGVHPFGFASGDTKLQVDTTLGLGSKSGQLLRAMLEEPNADRLLAAIAHGRLVAPSHLVATLSPFIDALLVDVLARAPALRPAAAELKRRFEHGETGSWWRERVDPRTRTPTTRGAPGLRGQILPLVGRDHELTRLTEALEGARANRPAVVWVGCSQGGGKWRLVTEFASRARMSDDPPIYLYTRWSSLAEARPAGALSIPLHRWLRLPIDGEPGEREERVLEELVGRRRTPTLLEALAPTQDEVHTPDSLPEALAAWLAALGQRRPVLLFVDELHRAGTVTLEALSALLDSLQGRVVLMLGVREDTEPVDRRLARLKARIEGLASSPTGPLAFTLSLEPLDRRALQALVNALFHSSVPRDRLADVLWRRSRGNPGLVNEILVDLLADGRARRRGPEEGAKLDLLVTPDELPRPRSLDRIVSERVAALEPDDRRWLERLSVVGGRIDAPFLVRAFPPTGRAEIDEVLARLVRRGWLVPAADRYRFARPALREVIYRSLSPRRRQTMHRGAARGLAPDPDAEQEPTLEETYQRAFHLHAGGQWDELLRLVQDLTEGRRHQLSARRLLPLATWGIEALEHADHLAPAERQGARLTLFETAADAANRLGRRSEERELLDNLVDLEIDHQDYPAEGARLYLLHARYAAGTGQLGLARGMAKNAVDLARASGDPALTSEALRRLGLVQGQIGALDAAVSLAREALVAAPAPLSRALAHMALAHLEILQDRLEAALRNIDLGESLLRSEEEPPSIGAVAYAQLLRARVWRSLGRAQRAYSAARRAVEMARRKGDRRLEAEARARMGGLLLDLDRPEDAEAQLRDAELLADEIEDRRGQVLARMFMAVVLHEEDDQRALELMRRTTEGAREIGFHRAEAFGLAMQARSLRESGDLAAADTQSARARVLLERHGAELPDRIVILGTRALVLRAQQKNGRAAVLVRRLERRIARAQHRMADQDMAHDLSTYGANLLAAVLSTEGPVLPRHRTPRPS